MNTKSNKVTKLLSLVLVLAMMVTVVLPTAVCAISPVTITTTLGDDSIIVNTETEFTVTIDSGSETAKVYGKIEINAKEGDVSSFEHFDADNDKWTTLPVSPDDDKLVGIFGEESTGGTGETTGGTGETTGGTGETTGGTGETTGGTGETTGGTGETTGGTGETTGGTTVGESITEVIKMFNRRAATPMAEKTSNFRIKFANVGDYSVKLFAYSAENDEVIAEEEVEISVVDYADYSSLDTAINFAEAYDSNEYTVGSFAVLEKAIDNAKAVDRDLFNTNQSVIDDLEDAINDAISALVKVKTVTFTAVAVADEAGADYAKANKIVLVFAEPVADNADVLSKLNIAGKVKNAVWTNDNTIYTLTLKDDHGLINATNVEFVNDDESILTKSGYSMKDTNAVVKGNLEEAYEEVTATDMTATIVNVDDKPYMVDGDKIVLVFNAPVYGKPSSIKVSDMPATVVTETNNTVYEIVLDADADTVSAGQTLTFVDAKNRTINATLTGTFGGTVVPEVVRALVEDVDGTAKTAGDKINVFFSAPTNKVAGAEETNFTGVLDGATGKWLDNQTLVITLGNKAITVDDKIDLSALEIKDFYATENVDVDEIALEGSFGTVKAPVIKSAYAVDNDGEATIANDQIVITFDRPTNGAAIDLKKDGIIANQATTFGSSSKYDWLDGNTKLVITLGSNANVENGLELDLSNQGIMDADSIIDADITPVVVEGSFGSSLEPKITRAIAFTQNNKHIIRTFFNTEVIVKENATLDVYVKNFDTPKGTWTTNGISYYDIVLKEGHDELESGAVIKFEGTLVDKKTGKMELKDAEITISGGFEQDIDMEILSLTAYSNDGSGIAKAGDRIVLVLNSEATAVVCDLGTFETEDNITWVYTLKNDNEVEIAKEVTFSSIKSKTNGKTYSNMKANIGGGFGYIVEPKLLSATAYSKDGSGIAKKGDEIIVVFDSKVSGVTSSLGNVSSDDGIVWKITLGDNPTISVGTTLNFAVKSVATGKEYNNLSVDLGGSFGKVVEPQILSATAYSNDGSGIAKAGDKIVVVFNAPVLYVTSALGTVSTNDNIVWTIELGTNPTITVGTEITFDVTSVATNKDHKGLKINLAGSFGEIVKPEIIRVTAISNNGSGVAKVGDKIVVVFDTEVKVGNADAAATYVYTYTLTAEDITSNKYAIGADYSIDVWSVATGKKYTLNSVVDGSYGYSEVPTVKSVVLAEENGIETITVVFDGAIDIYEADGTTKKSINVDTLKEKNAHLGKQTDAISAKWVDEYRLEITLGANTITSDASKLDLTGLGIKAKATGIALEDGAISGLAIKGTLIPVVKEVKALRESIIISFSTRTNGVANISNLTALLGTGATASWTDNNKTLTITLGENYTVTSNGYIVLNGMGIYDAFSGSYHVVGQYKILGSIDSDKLAVTKVVAQSTDKSKTTAQKGDTIVIKFNTATDLKGASLNQILDAEKVDEIISIGGDNEAALGTGYTGEWTAYDTLVITLGGSTTVLGADGAEPTVTGNDPAIAVGTVITVANVKFANGEGLMDATPVKLSGSFNGREFILTEGAITRTGANNTGDYRIAIKVEDTLIAPNIVPTVVCVAYNGTSPVSVMRICVDVENTIQPVFEFAEGLKITNAKIYVFNELFGDENSSPSVLAETIEIE